MMQILVRHGTIIDHCDSGYICTGTTAICPSTQKAFEDCTIINVDTLPSDIDEYTYYYESGKFIKGQMNPILIIRH